MKRSNQPVAKKCPTRGMSPAAGEAIDPTGPGTLEQTCFHVSRAYFNYVALLEQVLSDLDLATNVKPGMGHVLFALFERDNLIIKDLVHRISLAPSTLTGILSKMEAGSLITRGSDKADRRAVRVKLTTRGKSLRARAMLALKRVNAVMEATLSAGEVKTAKLSLTAMNQAMYAEAQRRKSLGRETRPPGSRA